MSFSLIGFIVFALGICFQAFLVRILGMPPSLAYIIQVVLSVQANFLANFRWTWSDRNAPFWRSCVRYNVKRTMGTLLSFALYPLLVMIGMNYLIANVVLVVMLTPANYILGHWWTFASGDSSARASSTRPMPPRVQLRQRLVVSAGVRRADLIHIPERTEPATPLCMQCGDVRQWVDAGARSAPARHHCATVPVSHRDERGPQPVHAAQIGETLSSVDRDHVRAEETPGDGQNDHGATMVQAKLIRTTRP